MKAPRLLERCDRVKLRHAALQHDEGVSGGVPRKRLRLTSLRVGTTTFH
jgi:hypothetical protein